MSKHNALFDTLKENKNLILFSFVAVLFFVWYNPYYQQQRILYEKYQFVLDVECIDGKFHPKVQHNLMTYDGIPTNCSHAQSIVSTPLFVSSLNAMWSDSIFYTLLHASTWQLQVAYAVVILVVSVALIVTQAKKHTVNAVLKNTPGTLVRVAKQPPVSRLSSS